MSARHPSKPLFPGGDDAVAGDGQSRILDGATTLDIAWSKPLSMALASMSSFHLEWNGDDSEDTTLGTGDLVATVQVWASNKKSPATPADDESDPDDWVQLSDISFPDEPDGSAGKTFLPLGNLGMRWIILRVQQTSGDGNVRGWAMAKDA